MNPILTLEEICLWILESYEPKHMSMNFDPTQSYSSMKYNTMEKDIRKKFTCEKEIQTVKQQNKNICSKKILAWLCKFFIKLGKCSVTKCF